jgi:uroporphyrinogen-III synthase
MLKKRRIDRCQRLKKWQNLPLMLMIEKITRHVVITRPSGPYAGGDKLAGKLRQAGFSTLELPVLACRVIPLSDETKKLLQEFYPVEKVWIAFLSPSALWVWSTVAASDAALMALTKRALIAVQGSGTAAACEECFGRRPDFIPSVFVAEEFAKEFALVSKPGQRVLVPQSAEGRDVFVPTVRRHGVIADGFGLYRLEPCEPSPESLLKFNNLQNEEPFVVFMSPSAVRAAVGVIGPVLFKMRIVSVGPITSHAVREAGLTVWREAQEHSEEGVLQALLSDIAGH